MIDRELAGFLEQGLGINIGARDAQLRPEGCRALAARVESDGRYLTVYGARAAVARLLPHLENTGQAAVTFGRPVDDRACQVKGLFVEAWDASEAERPIVTSQWEALLEQFEAVGIPRVVTGGWTVWPATAIRLKVTSVFDQTPGPQAGAPLA
jgi:hypothetical protein